MKGDVERNVLAKLTPGILGDLALAVENELWNDLVKFLECM